MPSRNMPLFQRKRRGPDGTTDEVLIGSTAAYLCIIIVIALLVVYLLRSGIDPMPLLKLGDAVTKRF